MYTMNPPDDEHIVARNMQRNMTNVIKMVHEVGT